jgi:hypothetical protein
VVGGLLGGLTGVVLDHVAGGSTPRTHRNPGFAWPLALVGLANGAISGWRRTYGWRTARGVGAFVLDSTWAVLTTAGALGSHVISHGFGDPEFDPSLSRRQNRHVYRGGFRPRPGFVVTVGNVISGAGETSHPRRRELVDVHEDAHVWQARTLGPIYPILYTGWMAGGAVFGALWWLAGHRDRRLFDAIETGAYYLNPLEWWAYSRDGNWPPPGMLAELAWPTSMVSASDRVSRETSAMPR